MVNRGLASANARLPQGTTSHTRNVPHPPFTDTQCKEVIDGLEALIDTGLWEALAANADAEARAGWSELRDALPAGTRAQIERRIEEVASLLAAIVKLEDEARDELVNRRGAALEGLERLATARRVNRAYGETGSPPPPGAQMTDQRG